MIIGKDRYKVCCFKGVIKQSSQTFADVAADVQEIMDALRKDGIDITKDPYWRLAQDTGRCEAMSEICKNELEQ